MSFKLIGVKLRSGQIKKGRSRAKLNSVIRMNGWLAKFFWESIPKNRRMVDE